MQGNRGSPVRKFLLNLTEALQPKAQTVDAAAAEASTPRSTFASTPRADVTEQIIALLQSKALKDFAAIVSDAILKMIDGDADSPLHGEIITGDELIQVIAMLIGPRTLDDVFSTIKQAAIDIEDLKQKKRRTSDIIDALNAVLKALVEPVDETDVLRIVQETIPLSWLTEILQGFFADDRQPIESAYNHLMQPSADSNQAIAIRLERFINQLGGVLLLLKAKSNLNIYPLYTSKSPWTNASSLELYTRQLIADLQQRYSALTAGKQENTGMGLDLSNSALCIGLYNYLDSFTVRTSLTEALIRSTTRDSFMANVFEEPLLMIAQRVLVFEISTAETVVTVLKRAELTLLAKPLFDCSVDEAFKREKILARITQLLNDNAPILEEVYYDESTTIRQKLLNDKKLQLYCHLRHRLSLISKLLNIYTRVQQLYGVARHLLQSEKSCTLAHARLDADEAECAQLNEVTSHNNRQVIKMFLQPLLILFVELRELLLNTATEFSVGGYPSLFTVIMQWQMDLSVLYSTFQDLAVEQKSPAVQRPLKKK